ncbi:MAG: class I SAM-dependent methyltransferase [Roseibium sp.]|uniref:class I SAM-dependent methyltransferase n=1 Tax=Roseibium sp. TaxID=1936156 RepID=UPI001AFEFE9D|nr:class I SAM-dependent methyltransferase [Roseibium sp.]MBO6891793.1 class I SAM-dependent methyltransferase [Roseibium sp.]MBO6931449.1 class I SAM-dependent methyltransferase [Roseibium sp.]
MLHLHFNPETDISKVLAPEALKMFQYEWGIYHKLVRSNEMQHREIGALIRTEIDRRFDRPFAFLDLACGDSSLARRILADTKISRYEGLDLSRPALECAAEVMKDVPYEIDLCEEDMVSGVKHRLEGADVIWCGFSIHHLQRPQKQNMLAAVRSALKPDGIFVTAEPVCRKGEQRADYVERWHDELRRRFQALSDTEFDHIWQHISTYDFAEPPEDWIEMGKRAGFRTCRLIYEFPEDFFCGAFLFER